jgi:hypothetical protein
MKLFTGLMAVVAYGASAYLLIEGFPVVGLYVALGASTLAIALIIVEWSRN